MRKAMLAFVMLAGVVTIAQLAGAVDDGFRGRYRVIGQRVSGNGCPEDHYTRMTHVHHINERVRQFGHPVGDEAGVFRHVRGEPRLWQSTHGMRYVLRYDPAIDSAVGVKGPGPQGCTWRVRLIHCPNQVLPSNCPTARMNPISAT